MKRNKMPEIPAECGVYTTCRLSGSAWVGPGNSDDDEVWFNTSTPSGRAALAAYCMAVIDCFYWQWMKEELDGSEDSNIYHMEVCAYWAEWIGAWKAYGGFT